MRNIIKKGGPHYTSFAFFILLWAGMLFFASFDNVHASAECPTGGRIFNPSSPENCTDSCKAYSGSVANWNDNGYYLPGADPSDTRGMCCCKPGPSTGSGGSGSGSGSGAGGGGSARVRTGTSTGGTKPACPSAAFLERPKDPGACGAACGENNYSEALFEPDGFSNDTTGAKKCCCTEKRGTGSAACDPTNPDPRVQERCANFGPNVANPFGAVFDVPMLVGKTLRWFMGILGVIALVIFIYGGFLWMISLGDETRVKKGRETMIWAGMGLIAIVGSYVVIQFILETVL